MTGRTGGGARGTVADEAARRARFLRRLHRWYARAGRHDLPWQRDRRGYAVWVSEIMLQQTTVETVARYYPRFLRRFPTLRALAEATTDEVLHAWAGLGYYRRAHDLHAAARRVLAQDGGRLPRSLDALVALPGIGRSTAGAVLSLAYDRPAVVLDTNVRRVLERFWSGALRRRGGGERALWDLAAWLLPPSGGRAHTQGLMDLGALVCRPRRPLCPRCPLVRDCPGPGAEARAEKKGIRPARRTRRLDLLYLRDRGGRLFLVRRPPRGVWAGLWCPPEAEGGETAEAALLLRRRHALSHLDLDIRLLRPSRNPVGRLPEEGVWTTPAERARLALPPVVRAMLESVPRP